MLPVCETYLRLAKKEPTRSAEWIERLTAYKASLCLGRPFAESAEAFLARPKIVAAFAEINAAIEQIKGE